MSEKNLPPADGGFMKLGLPTADANGAYWWFKPSGIDPAIQVLFVWWLRGAVRAACGGRVLKVSEMKGEWCGPIPWPTCWDTCERGIVASGQNWKLYYHDQWTGKDCLSQQGQETEMRLALTDAINRGEDAWLVGPHGQKVDMNG